MEKSTAKGVSIVLAALGMAASVAHAAAFGPGHLAVFEAAASASNTTASIVEINTTTAAQAALQTLPIEDTDANGLRFSGSATSTGYLSRTADGSLLTFAGAVTQTTTGNINTFTTRGIGTLNASGNYSLATSYTGTSGNQARSATSLDNSAWYISDQGGVYTNNATAPSPVANTRGIKPFGGSVYALQASSSTTVPVISTVSAPSAGSLTGLPGLTNDPNATDFYLLSSGSNGAALDVLYTLDDTSGTAGTINKFSLVNNTWSSSGSYTTSFGGFGLAAASDGAGADLFVTSGTGATTANSVIKLTDTAGYNAPISITTANNATLFTAPTGTILKGIDFAPISASATPEPASLGLLVLGAASLLTRRRK